MKKGIRMKDKRKETVEKLAKEAKAKEITLMLENDVKPFDNPSSLQKILRKAPELKILLDVGHANIQQKTNQTKNFFKKFGKKICHIHVSDNHGEKDEHLAIGKGNINWKEIIKTIKEFNYNKTTTIEVFTNKKEAIKSKNKIKKLYKNKRKEAGVFYCLLTPANSFFIRKPIGALNELASMSKPCFQNLYPKNYYQEKESKPDGKKAKQRETNILLTKNQYNKHIQSKQGHAHEKEIARKLPSAKDI